MNLDKEVFELSMDDILPNRFQPREVFDEQALNELALSIREHGVIQPIIVRKIGDKYEIVAGERRFRASQIAGKKTIPALVRNIDDKESAKIALLENLQRKNLTSIEEARTYDTILKLDNMTQEELANNLGKSQSTVANKLRLLNLDESVQDALLKEQISERHARSLLNVPDKNKQKELLNKVIMNRMTVKQLDDEISLLTENKNNNISYEEEKNVIKDDSIFTLPKQENLINQSDLNGINNLNNNLTYEIKDTSFSLPEENKQNNSFINNSIFFTNPTPKPTNNDISNLTIEQILANYNLNNKKQEVPKQEEIINNEAKDTIDEYHPKMEDFSKIINPISIDEIEEKHIPEDKPINNDIPLNFDIETERPNKSNSEGSLNSLSPQNLNISNNSFNEVKQNIEKPSFGFNNSDVYDLRFAINNFRQAVQNTEKFGFKINVEEFDFDNVYQIVIRIDKNKQNNYAKYNSYIFSWRITQKRITFATKFKSN